MLIHVTRFTSVQATVHAQVESRVHRMRQRLVRRIDHESVLAELQTLWDDDFTHTSERMAKDQDDPSSDRRVRWQEIEAILPEVIADIQVRMINGTAKDALDYADNRETGLKVIAIGGDKLARGLTLEGLTVSYFLRASRMYDTLMQMGRWFGLQTRISRSVSALHH